MSNKESVVCPQKTVNELWEVRAREKGDKIYLYFQDQEYSYREINGIYNQVAGHLKESAFSPGDNAAILVPNSPEFLFFYFGIMKAGGRAVTLNTLLKADELEYIINDCDARVLCTTPHFLKLLEPVWEKLTKIERVILTEKPENKPPVTQPITYMAEIREKGDAGYQLEPPVKADDIAQIIYTSGTTGRPKGVMLDHANIIYNSYVAPRKISLEEDDIGLCIMPLFHVNAQIASMMSTLQVGASVVLEEMFKPRSFIKTLKKYRCTTFSAVPTIYNYLNEMKDTDGEKLDFLKACVCGAAPMPVDVFNKFEEKFSAKIIEGYGLSEGTCVSSLNPLEGKRKIGSIGIPIDGQEMAIWDDEGKPLPDGEIGEIVIKGPNVMRGYYGNDKATNESVRDGWLRTGDQGYRDQDGYYFISGRKKEMIIRGGENIYPKEIEEVLYEHEDVSECAVIGIPDKKYGEEVAAFVILVPGSTLTTKDIKNYLRVKLADYKRPRVIDIVHDLPKTATGKVQKVKLVEEYTGNMKLINKVDGNVRIPYRWVYGKAVAKFYNGLKNEAKFYGTRCPKCQKVQIPPKSFCGVCFEECAEFVELPNKGTLESYTTVHMEFPGQPTKPPYTYGYVRLDGAHTHLYHLVDVEDESEIQVGTRVEAVWEDAEKRTGNLYDIRHFKPIS